jgi:short-subunit dehydrogenase
VTGASSGIGSEFARPIAQRRLNVEMTAGNRFGEWLRVHKDGEQ